MLTKVKLLFSLADPAEEKSISLVDESTFCLLKEDNSGFKVSELSADTDCDHSVFEWVKLHAERLDHFVVKLDQLNVLCLVKSGIFGVVDQVVCNLMPHPLRIIG